MSLTIPSSIAALPAAIQNQAPGHKRGWQASLADTAATPAAQTPVGSTQNALGRLFGFVAQTLGIPLPPTTAAQAAAGAGAAAPGPAAVTKIDLTA